METSIVLWFFVGLILGTLYGLSIGRAEGPRSMESLARNMLGDSMSKLGVGETCVLSVCLTRTNEDDEPDDEGPESDDSPEEDALPEFKRWRYN